MPTLAEILRQTGYSNDGELSAPVPTAPTMTSILQKHIASLPQQLATNQQAMDNTIQSWNKTDFGTGQPNPNYRPEALNEFAQLVPNMLGATAWHGTPHEIKGLFDIGKVGTGEGAQAYGHGMYFAESKDLADVYRKKLTNETGNQVKNPNDSIQLQMGNLENQIKQLKQSNDPNAGTMIKAYQNRIDEINKAGNLYKVDIPDEHIPHMLDWDKPFSEQTPFVQKALKEIAKDEGLPMGFSIRGNAVGGSLMQSMPNKIEATRLLQEQGVTGVRYLDEGSRSTGKGTSNFVMFDPSTVKILEKNGVTTRKEILEQQLNNTELPQDYHQLNTMVTKAYDNLNKNPNSKQAYEEYLYLRKARDEAPLNNPSNIQKQIEPVIEDYKGQHQAPTKDSGKPLHDLTDIYPEDFYSHNGVQYYGTGSEGDARVISQLQSLRNRPNSGVWMYRAVPKNAESVINKGDWVTIDRQYAKEHGESALNGDYKIVRRKATARDLFTNGDSPYEMGYDPQPRLSRKELLQNQIDKTGVE